MHTELAPCLRLPVTPTSNVRALHEALAELRESITTFNKRWLAFVWQLDFDSVNQLRDGYNRFYLMEKECAVGSVRVARQGFRKLDMLRPDDILKIFPLLAVP